jgi:hypothetical protein
MFSKHNAEVPTSNKCIDLRTGVILLHNIAFDTIGAGEFKTCYNLVIHYL